MIEEKSMIGQTEEITDILTPEGVRSGDFYKDQLLKFDYEGSKTNIVITKLDKKNGRAWGRHVEITAQNTVFSHYGHLVDNTKEAIDEHGVPYCNDCEVPVNVEASLDGKTKAVKREEGTLSDGTIIKNAETTS